MLREDKPVVRAVPAGGAKEKCELCCYRGKCIEWNPVGPARVLSPLRCYEGYPSGGGVYFIRVQR